MRLHFLQHVSFENPGAILLWAEENRFTVTSTQLYLGQRLPQPEEFDWLVVMGGPMNIYEEGRYPWLSEEKELIRESISCNKMVLGFCLGAQLIADVLGGRVAKNPVKEIGWHTVTFTKEAEKIRAFKRFPKELTVFQWHGDTFSDLPEEVTLLAESEACLHQAFCYKSRVFGFQFHLENTGRILKNLIKNCEDEIQPGPYVQTKEEMLSHPEYIEKSNEWMFLFLTNLYQAGK
ncbi:type 1 glutamine amidotransferase [Clostridium sp. Marseille-P2415]|uniref:type 1 glutamine amidotransferase n=1 Tax=Clostridium sp. Marseille-P2415 TaxID=1805471 RepID=UPI0009886200|nr:type 1 glutamine amidotransferase [Clostridium sp. Marseille-P2415]